jgi:hypothetical protein
MDNATPSIRNIAIIARVDQGKTALVDASEGPPPQTLTTHLPALARRPTERDVGKKRKRRPFVRS